MICTAAGVVFSSALKQRCERLRAVISMMGEMSSRIRYRAVPLPELIGELSDGELYGGLGFLKRIRDGQSRGLTVQEAWKEAAKLAPYFSDRDRSILADIGGRLGDSDTDGQLAMLSQASELLGASLAEAEADCAKRSGALLKVWTLCGIGAGMVII